MENKNDLRGVVTIAILFIFAAVIFVPPMMGVVISDTLVQSVITLAVMVVGFYFSNKSTIDKM